MFLKEDGVDLCMLGEGEDVFSALAAGLSDSWRNLPGLAWLENDTVVSTGLAAPVDLNRISFLYHDLSLFENRILYYESSRGCPFSCAYCLSGRERGIRYRNPEVVEEELQFFLDQRVRQVKFIDRTFNADPVFAMRVWRYISDHDNGITNFHFEIEADRLTEEELELLVTLRSGMVQMEIGVQSANPNTLRSVHRRPDLTRIWDAVARLVPAQNINLHLDLITGLPYEDMASFQHSFNEVYGMQPHGNFKEVQWNSSMDSDENCLILRGDWQIRISSLMNTDLPNDR